VTLLWQERCMKRIKVLLPYGVMLFGTLLLFLVFRFLVLGSSCVLTFLEVVKPIAMPDFFSLFIYSESITNDLF